MPADSLPTKRKRPLSYVRLLVYCAVFGLVLGGFSGLIDEFAPPFANVARAVMILGVLAAVLFGTLLWWRGADEAVREAHKWAWYWGGSAGIAVGAIIILLVYTGPENLDLPIWAGAAPADHFVAGVVAILLFQMVGYGIAWATWWLRHR